MPRDASPRELGEITVGGARRARIIPTSTAGRFALYTQSTWVDRLRAAGTINAEEFDAAVVVHSLFEQSGVRPRLAGDYDGVHVNGGGGGGGLLETLGRPEFLAWRRCNALLDEIPRRYRSQVSAVVCWDCRPWNLPELRLGLRALSAAIRQPRRR